MVQTNWESVRRHCATLFPDRDIHVHAHGQAHVLRLTSGRQMLLAASFGAVLMWMGVCTAATLASTFSINSADQAAVRARNYYERLIADRQARLDSAVAALNNANTSVVGLAKATERRHAALALLISDIHGAPGLAQALKPAPLASLEQTAPLDGVKAVREDQDRLITQAETYAKTRAERLRLALRLAGLEPSAYNPSPTEGLGGPLIEAKDPRALAVVLDVDEAFAGRIQRAALDLSATQVMQERADTLPLAKPASNTERASGFGVRLDPFTHRPAFHAGLDFAGPMLTPIYSTAPGVVSFTGVRTGYGNTVEIDHGRGFKTRYAHLSSIGVAVGQRVALGQRIAAMGSTGRSTGPHLHYEVWVDGRPQNPARFLEAGEYVQQNTP